MHRRWPKPFGPAAIAPRPSSTRLTSIIFSGSAAVSTSTTIAAKSPSSVSTPVPCAWSACTSATWNRIATGGAANCATMGCAVTSAQPTPPSPGCDTSAGKRSFFWGTPSGRGARWPAGVGAGDLIAQYPGRVAAADAAVGRLLQAIADFGLERQTLVVLHADHGRSLLEHGGVLLGGELYESSVHVPLIVRWPGALPAGHRVDTLVHLIDIFPTLAYVAGLSTPRNLDGESLNGVIHGIGRRGAPEAYAETYVPATAPAGQETEVDGEQGGFGFVRRAIRTQRWKYIRSEPSTPLAQPESAAPPPELPRQSAREELYDLSRDPGETVNLIDQEPAVATALRGQLEQHGAAPTR